MVSAWSSRNQMVLGQVKTEEKSNEITAIPRLLELLQVSGCLVTIDAMGCQKDIAAKIVASNADYMLGVKDNQSKLAAAIVTEFDTALADPHFAASGCETRDREHGRIEVRRCWTLNANAECGEPFDQWPGLASIVRVESERTVGGKTSRETRHYISSRTDFHADDALAASRAHWSIENQLHWVLDVAFREDDCRVRAKNAGENFAVVRHFAVNMLKSAPSPLKSHPRAGIKTKRLFAAGNTAYLFRVFGIYS
jgi:predicted transposase YbfD/YdcC